MFNYQFIAKFLFIVTVKNFSKLFNRGLSYEKKSVWLFM